MNRLDEIDQDDVLRALRASVSATPVPPAPTMAALVARVRRRRRRAVGVLGVGAAAAAAVGIGLSGLATTGGGSATGSAHLAAFSLVSNKDGTATLTVPARQVLTDPAALGRALAAHGVPALVTEGRFCTSNPAVGTLDGIVTQSPSSTHAQVRTAPNGDPVAPQPGAVAIKMVINPAAIPPGTELSLGYFDGQLREAALALISRTHYTCSSVQPVNPPPGGLMAVHARK